MATLSFTTTEVAPSILIHFTSTLIVSVFPSANNVESNKSSTFSLLDSSVLLNVYLCHFPKSALFAARLKLSAASACSTVSSFAVMSLDVIRNTIFFNPTVPPFAFTMILVFPL